MSCAWLIEPYRAIQCPVHGRAWEEAAREGMARLPWARAAFRKHLPQVPRARGDGDTAWDLCFHLNFVTLWMKGTFRKFVK